MTILWAKESPMKHFLKIMYHCLLMSLTFLKKSSKWSIFIFSHPIRIRDWWYNVIKVASWRKYIQSRLEMFKNKSTYSVWSFDNLLNTSMSICVIRLLSSHLQWYTDIKKLLQLHLQCTKNTEIQILVINI